MNMAKMNTTRIGCGTRKDQWNFVGGTYDVDGPKYDVESGASQPRKLS